MILAVSSSAIALSTYTRSIDGAVLPGVRDRAPDEAVRRALEVRVGQHDRRVLAAELERAGDRAARRTAMATFGPLATLPVKTTRSTSAAQSAAPSVAASLHELAARRRGGARRNASTMSAPARGVTSLGLKRMALPARSAGTMVRSGSATGKFHGVMRATTPRGSRSMKPRLCRGTRARRARSRPARAARRSGCVQ